MGKEEFGFEEYVMAHSDRTLVARITRAGGTSTFTFGVNNEIQFPSRDVAMVSPVCDSREFHEQSCNHQFLVYTSVFYCPPQSRLYSNN
jgi:hypothetical protein